MRRIWITLTLAALAALVPFTAAGQDTSAVMASVHKFVNAFNKGDTKTAASVCDDQTSIIDEFSPHEWHGPHGCDNWMAAYDADAKKNGITDPMVTLGTPRHVDVTADHAYVVLPANYAYKQNGKLVKETGSLLTLALRKGVGGWRIAGWSWTKN